MSGLMKDHKPAFAMLLLQFCYAAATLVIRATLLQGMSPRVFVVYRQLVATLVLAPIAFFSRRSRIDRGPRLGMKSFSLILLASLIGVTINQNMYFEGLYLASSSLASAMGNLVPGITFILSVVVGFEKITVGSIRSMAKIVGTLLCVSGAISMALLRGQKLLNTSIFGSPSANWLLGTLLLFGSACCWSIWLILQVPVSAIYPDHVSFSAWMCFLGTLQSATVTFFLEKDPEAWQINSYLEILSCLFTGIVGSGLSFVVQAWCISLKGPLFSAMFNPLSTVIVTILAALFLHEEIYIGSMVGAVGVIIGLYIVLWGKAEDFSKKAEDFSKKGHDAIIDQTVAIKIMIEEPEEEIGSRIDLAEPLLSQK